MREAVECFFRNKFHADGDQNIVTTPIILQTLCAHVTDELLDDMFVDRAIVGVLIQAVEVLKEIALVELCSWEPLELEGDGSTSKRDAAS